jgi:hypothetical protein
MPFIRFTEKATEGEYLVLTHDAASWFPDGIVGIREKTLRELKDEFAKRGIRYERLSVKELNQRTIKAGEDM